MNNRIWLSAAATFLAFSLTPLLPTANTAIGHAETTAPIKVAAARTILTPVVHQIELIGTVIAKHRAEIASKVSGTINEFPVYLGSNVVKNQLLVGISAGEIDAQVRQAEAQLQQARRNLEREEKLLSKNAATPENVKSLTESLAIAEAAVEEARTIQSYTRITSPFSGTVTGKTANQGDLATPGKPLLEIEDLSHLQVLTDIPEARSLSISLGDELPVHLPAANLTVTGIVVEIAPTTNPTTRSAAVKLDIPGHSLLRPGQFARVMLSGQDDKTLTVPRSSLIYRGQMAIVYVLQDNVAWLRLVKTGTRHDDQVEILSGLDEGELVVTSGNEKLTDGQAIELR